MIVVARAIFFILQSDEMYRCKEGVKNDTDEPAMFLHVFTASKFQVEFDRAVTFKKEHHFFFSNIYHTILSYNYPDKYAINLKT